MTDSLCTVVMVPRDRFSLAEASFESLRANTPAEYPVIYVDSCHPQPWAGRLDTLAAEGKITLIRSGFYLSQFEAYNLAIPHVRTKYVIFADNDPLFTPGWAENLVKCAEETGASVVTPLYEEKQPGQDWKIHMCGGDCGVEERNGQLCYTEVHPHQTETLREDLTRCRTGQAELHAFLITKEALEKIGPFDEKVWFALNHADFSLMVRASGGTIWVEPASSVKFLPPPPVAWQDVGFFFNIWSSDATERSLRYFSQKWGVPILPHTGAWYRRFRRRTLNPIRLTVARWFGALAGKIAWSLFWPAEAVFAWAVVACTKVPNRRERFEALGPWRARGLDPARIKAFGQKMFSEPRPLGRELTLVDEPEASVALPIGVKS